MLYIHYCETCDIVHILNGHKKSCPKCDAQLNELPLSFLEYTAMNAERRDEYLTEYKSQQ